MPVNWSNVPERYYGLARYIEFVAREVAVNEIAEPHRIIERLMLSAWMQSKTKGRRRACLGTYVRRVLNDMEERGIAMRWPEGRWVVPRRKVEVA